MSERNGVGKMTVKQAAEKVQNRSLPKICTEKSSKSLKSIALKKIKKRDQKSSVRGTRTLLHMANLGQE